MEHPAQGKRSDTLGFTYCRASAPCKGKSFNPLCCYSYLIADLAVLKWNIVCVFVQHLPHVLRLLPLQGATAPTRDTQGAASLALGYVLHWAFSPPLLNPRVEILTRQPVNPKFRQWVGSSLKLNLQVTLRVPQTKVFRLLFVAYIYLSYFCTIKGYIGCATCSQPNLS